MMTANFWYPTMKKGIITFPRPEDCPLHKPLHPMEIKPFGEALNNFSGLKEFEEVE
jgi:CRISPR-associated protein Cas5d